MDIPPFFTPSVPPERHKSYSASLGKGTDGAKLPMLELTAFE
jgi:hypothetical protein